MGVKGRRSLPIYSALDIHLVERRLGRPWLMRHSGFDLKSEGKPSTERVSPMVTMRLAFRLLSVGLRALIIEADASAAFSYFYGPLQSFSEGLSLRLAIQYISVRCEIILLLGGQNSRGLSSGVVRIFGNNSFRLKALFPHDWSLFSGTFRLSLHQYAILSRPHRLFPSGYPGPLVRISSVDLKQCCQPLALSLLSCSFYPYYPLQPL